MKIWDYDLPADWQPQTDAEWEWFLIRKINYGELEGLSEKKLKKHYPQIKRQLDPGKRDMLANYLKA